MDASEVFEWMAYELTQDPEYREKIEKEINIEHQKAMSDEERSNLIKEMFAGLRKNK